MTAVGWDTLGAPMGGQAGYWHGRAIEAERRLAALTERKAPVGVEGLVERLKWLAEHSAGAVADTYAEAATELATLKQQLAESTPSPDTEGVAMEGAESVVQRWREIDRKAGTDTNDEDEDSYNIGVQDGFQEAVQTLDLLTGGDGEYRFCTDKDPERHCPDPVFMIRNILDRFALRTAQNTGRDEVLELRELLRQTMNALACADKNDPNEPIADNGMTVWDGMKAEAERLWPRVTTALSSPPVSTVDEEGGGS